MKMDGICMVFSSNFVVGELAMVYKRKEPNVASRQRGKYKYFLESCFVLAISRSQFCVNMAN
jgi:hypothetical protein